MNIHALYNICKIGFQQNKGRNSLMATDCRIVLGGQGNFSGVGLAIHQSYDLFIAIYGTLLSPGEFLGTMDKMREDYNSQTENADPDFARRMPNLAKSVPSLNEIYDKMGQSLCLCLKTPSRMAFIPLSEVRSITFDRMRGGED